jgi:3-oxoadipate enol-lactonase
VIPDGRALELPGRGTTFVRELPGPVGAPTIVLLHGLSATAGLNWYTAFPALGERYRVVAIDHRGHGHGIRSRRRFRLADCADDVAAVCDQLGIRKATMVGYSMGGPISLLTWHRHRPLVTGLVLCATAADFTGDRPGERFFFDAAPGLAMAARMTPDSLRRQALGRMINRRVAGSVQAEWIASELRSGDPLKLMEAVSSLGRFDARSWVPEIDVPTSVVRTLRDRAVPPRRQTFLAETIPGAKIFDVDGDHVACVTDAGVFVTALVTALRHAAPSLVAG